MACRASLPIALALALAFAAGAQADGTANSCTIGCHSCLAFEISSTTEDSYFAFSGSGTAADACTSCDAGYYKAAVDRCIGEDCYCPNGEGDDCEILSLDSYVVECVGSGCDCDSTYADEFDTCATTAEEICALLFEDSYAPTVTRKMLIDNDISTYVACVRAYGATGRCPQVRRFFPRLGLFTHHAISPTHLAALSLRSATPPARLAADRTLSSASLATSARIWSTASAWR